MSLGKHLFTENHLIRLIKNDTWAGCPQAVLRGGLGKAFGSLVCGFGAEWFWRKELTA